MSNMGVQIACVSLIVFAALPAIAQQTEVKLPMPAKQDSTPEPRTIRLWERAAPGALGNEDADVPSITWYARWNQSAPSTAVIVAPGGGYEFLATNHEGRQVANWLNALGVTAFILKYRLGPRYRHAIELGDAQRSVRFIGSRAKEFGIRPDRIGLMGFSAG